MSYVIIPFKNHGLKAGTPYVYEDGKFREPIPNDRYYCITIVAEIIDNDNFACWTNDGELCKLNPEYKIDYLESILNALYDRMAEDFKTKVRLEKELKDAKLRLISLKDIE